MNNSFEVIKVKSVTLQRQESEEKQIGPKKSFKSLRDAQTWLRSQTKFFPKTGHDTYEFLITWEDGSKYSGELQVMHPDNEQYTDDNNDIREQVRDFIYWAVKHNKTNDFIDALSLDEYEL